MREDATHFSSCRTHVRGNRMPWSAAITPKWIMCRWIDVQFVVPKMLQGSWHVTLHLAWLARTEGILLEIQHKRRAEKLNKLFAFIENRARNCVVTNKILCVQRIAMVLTNISHFFPCLCGSLWFTSSAPQSYPVITETWFLKVFLSNLQHTTFFILQNM